MRATAEKVRAQNGKIPFNGRITFAKTSEMKEGRKMPDTLERIGKPCAPETDVSGVITATGYAPRYEVF